MNKLYILFGLLAIIVSVQGYEVASKCPEGKKTNETRPCPKNKISCVRKFFQTNAECQQFACRKEDKLYMDSMKLYTLFFNMTITQEDVTTTGLSSGQIEDFIVDYTNNLVVLTVKYTNIGIDSKVTNFVYYQSAKEPKAMITTTTELYRTVIITSYFFDAIKPQISNSFHVANVKSLPDYTLGPCITKNKDPVAEKLFKEFTENIGVAVQESFSTRSKIFQTKWIQENICNYGVDL